MTNKSRRVNYARRLDHHKVVEAHRVVGVLIQETNWDGSVNSTSVLIDSISKEIVAE